MKKKKSINKKKVLIIILIITIIIFIVLSLILNELKKKDTQKRIEMKRVDTTYEEQTAKLDIVVENLYEMVKLSNRSIDTKEYTDRIKKMIEGDLKYTHIDTKDLSKTELEKQFEENKQDIFNQYGIEEFDTYKKLVEKLEIYEEPITVEEVRIVKNSCYVEEQYIISKINIKYDNGKQLELTLKFANDDTLERPYLRII